MKKTLVEGFLAFVNAQYGITMIAKESDHGESFQDLFGYELNERTNADTMSKCHLLEKSK